MGVSGTAQPASVVVVVVVVEVVVDEVDVVVVDEVVVTVVDSAGGVEDAASAVDGLDCAAAVMKQVTATSANSTARVLCNMVVG
eukprot:m.332312 g.332312  ORF g.332312 m.332312 type:complete len:84 (-) comp16057_c0_seq4:511-762(-)